MSRLFKEKPKFIDEYERDFLPIIGDTSVLDQQLGLLTEELNELYSQIEKLVQDNSRHVQNQETYEVQFNSLSASIEQKKAEVSCMMEKLSETLCRRENIHIFLEGLKHIGSIEDEFDIPTWHALVDYIRIMSDQRIVFILRDGHEESVPFAEVR